MPDVIVIEGKTKIIREDPDDPNAVLAQSKDDITAHDGLGHELLTGKGVASTTTTGNVFRLLEEAGIPHHCLGQVSDDTFRARRMTMIPIEVVMRRLAWGSFLDRHPEIPPKHEFRPVRVEFFGKDDNLSPPEAGKDTKNDPLLIVDIVTNRTLRFKPKQPMGKPGSFIDELPGLPAGLELGTLRQLAVLGRRVFETIEDELAGHDVALVDLKIELGVDSEGTLRVADVIDNDSWRIWPGGDPDAMKDKQVFRDWVTRGDFSDKEQKLAEIGEDYHWVAELSVSFGSPPAT